MPQQDTSLIRLDQFRADARFSGINGTGTTVVVIDTGIDLNHSFFGTDADSNGIADRIVYSYDFSGSNDSNASDTDGHGSNVASIVASQDATYTGMATGCNLIVLKVFPDGSGSAFTSDIVEALDWVVANRATYNIVSVNMSLGTFSNNNSSTSTSYSSDFANLVANNCAVVVASGNSYYNFQTQGVSSPSSDPNAWSVGAVWDRADGGWAYGSGAIDYVTGPDRIAAFSQRSTTMTTIFAPGGDITGANWNGGTIREWGTSQAAPHIAGLVADMQQLAVQVSGHLMSVTDLRTTMQSSAAIIVDGDDENDNVANTGGTYKRVDALAWGVAILDKLFAGTAGVDTLTGTSVADTIHGLAGADTLSGGDGNDSLYGDDGNDTLYGQNGNDYFLYASTSNTFSSGILTSLAGGVDSFDGSTGSDTADFSQLSNLGGRGVLVTESGANYEAWALSGGLPIKIATLVSVENATGTPYDDTLQGMSGANVLSGGAGADQLEGFGANDSVIGGSGSDTAVFTGNRADYSITYNITAKTFTVVDQRSGTPDGTDSVTGVETLQFSDTTYDTVASTTQTTNNPDGTKTITMYDVGATNTWFSQVSLYDTSNRLTRVTTNNDNGTYWIDSLNPAHDSYWSDYFTSYDSSWNVTYQRGTYESGGTHWINLYDTANTSAWTWYMTNYDTSWNVTYQRGFNDNGTFWINSYDTANTSSWSWFEGTYDSVGNLLYQRGTYDDSTHWIAVYDIPSAQSWYWLINFYDASWNLTRQRGVNDDGSTWETVYSHSTEPTPLDTSASGGSDATPVVPVSGSATASDAASDTAINTASDAAQVLSPVATAAVNDDQLLHYALEVIDAMPANAQADPAASGYQPVFVEQHQSVATDAAIIPQGYDGAGGTIDLKSIVGSGPFYLPADLHLV